MSEKRRCLKVAPFKVMMDTPRRSKRLAAKTAVSSFVVPEESEDSSVESAEEDLSGFQTPKDDISLSSTETSGPESGKFSSPRSPSPSFVGGGNASENKARRFNVDTRGPSVPPITHIMPPYGRVGFFSRTPQEIVLDVFQDELNYHAKISSEQLHPFWFFSPRSGLPELSAFFHRQRMLFSLNAFTAVPKNDIEMYLPESSKCPKIVFLEDQKRVNAARYHFDQEHKIFYTGGYVKCLSWSPPCVDDQGVFLTFVPSYLAVASYPNIGTRINLSDPAITDFGLIHIWSCSGLALTAEQSHPNVKPHFFLAHDWGYVMDLRWLPIPVQFATRPGVSDEIRTSVPGMDLSANQIHQLVGGVVGHLIAACTDGFVRVFPIPACDNRTDLSGESQIVIPATISTDGTPNNIYKFKPKTVLRLAPSTDIPPWLGWPNTLAIRSDFPHRLVVGYTSGHLALYNLSTLDPYFLNPINCLLRPALLTHLLPGPFTSIALHPLYESIVIGLGLDRDINVWDLSDGDCVTSGGGVLSELSWSMIRMGWGGCVVWPRAGDAFWIGRQEYIFPFCNTSKSSSSTRAVSLAGLKTPSDVPSRLRPYTTCFPTVSPVDCARNCLDRGFEATTCLEYSDAFALLIQGDANGQINFHSWILTPCRVMREKARANIQKKHRMYQWIMRKRPDNEANDSGDQLTSLNLNVLEEPFEEELAEGCDLCGENGQTLCWHKVEQKFEFIFREGVGLKKSKYDFINSTFSSITKLAASPDPASASWLAVGTGFGVVQLICHDQFYHPGMDKTLGRPPLVKGPAKGSFFVPRQANSSHLMASRSSKSEDSARNGSSKATFPVRRSTRRR
ncbi:hypothetical protein Aperf_G00000096739 [Anoplocephala perfoliata]